MVLSIVEDSGNISVVGIPGKVSVSSANIQLEIMISVNGNNPQATKSSVVY